MNTKQTWKIRGQVYTHGQLLELKKQGLNPHKDSIVLATVMPHAEPSKPVEEPKVEEPKMEEPKVEEKEKHYTICTQEMLDEYPELVEQGVKVGDKMQVGEEEDAEPARLQDMHLSVLKKMAKEKGMKVTNETKKKDVLEFLEANK